MVCQYTHDNLYSKYEHENLNPVLQNTLTVYKSFDINYLKTVIEFEKLKNNEKKNNDYKIIKIFSYMKLFESFKNFKFKLILIQFLCLHNCCKSNHYAK